ncbi:thioredoxin TrxC [Aliiglaciecola sp. CAU 1673]|uniref:thioredoxin TrxC n=1 Tax=Aliiglaciecola sp. CAU 1673 TaxID=3032595 RepID=UPI0023DAFD51|nr:thioredoxin TrxC [Aliiglaciecola sp. CAU 1673]MDF2179673.1 thioredoxin TrxC [Aliiglaciecola sp. CAU 1673]
MDNNLQLVCGQCAAVNRIPVSRLEQQPLCGKCKAPLLSGKPIEATDETFLRHIERNDMPVLVDFWAPWCGPCLNFAPVFSEAAKELEHRIRFIKLDTQANQHSAARYQIRSIPTLMLFAQGKELARVSGALPKHSLMQWLAQHLVE